MAGEAFENSDGRTLRLDHGGARNDESLLESVLTFENGVADAVSEHNPTGIGRKFPSLLGAGFAEALVFLHGVVATVHEIVIGRAP